MGLLTVASAVWPNTDWKVAASDFNLKRTITCPRRVRSHVTVMKIVGFGVTQT